MIQTLLPDHFVGGPTGQRHDGEGGEDGQPVGPRVAFLVAHLELAGPPFPLTTFIWSLAEQQRRRTTVEPTQEELSAARSSRLQTQTNDPNYLKDTPKASPCRERPDSVADIPIQTIDLEVPLHIPGLASTDSYYNLR